MAENRINPWLGLESYKENQIIYGRNEEIADLSQRVLNDVDTVVHGKSGIGKTSIINAGVLPIARLNGYVPVVLRLDHSCTKGYVAQLRETLSQVVEIREHSAAKDCGHELLWEFLHRNEFWSGGRRCKLLLIFDQFEEIFTLQNNQSATVGFFAELGDVLNDIMPGGLLADDAPPSAPSDGASAHAATPTVEGFEAMSYLFSEAPAAASAEPSSPYVDDNEVHFIFALREDFLSDFEYFTAKIPSLKHHRFALRPLNEEQAADIIVKPRPGLVSMDVARLIIETVTGRTDFTLGDEPEIEVDAAVLSLFLSRIYQKMPSGATAITLDLVREFGANIIKDFYTEAIGDLTAGEVEILEDRLLTSSGRRNNVSRSDLRKIIPDGKISALVERRKLLRTFNYGNDIRLEFIHDILCPIVKERREQREQLRLQEEERRRQEEETQRAIAEEQRKRKEVERMAAEEQARLKAEARLARRRNRKRMAAIVVSAFSIVLLLGCYFAYDYLYNAKVYDEYYAQYETVKGWPVGVGKELSAKERQTAPLYYKLSYTGLRHKGRFTDVEVMSSNRYLPDATSRIPSMEWADGETADSRALAFNGILSSVKRVHFSASENDSLLSQEEYYGESNEPLMTVSYFYISPQNAMAQYFTPKGGNMKIRANGLDRMRIGWDASGRIVSKVYYDAHEVPQTIVDGESVTGYLWDYAKADTVVRYAVNEFGLPATDVLCNTHIVVQRADTTVTLHAKSTETYQPNPSVADCKEGYAVERRCGNTLYLFDASGKKHARRVYATDASGNVVSIETSGNTLFSFPQRENYQYSEGRLLLREYLSATGGPFEEGSDRLYCWRYEYDAAGKVCEETRYNCRKRMVYHRQLTVSAVKGGYVQTELLEETKADSLPLAYLLRKDSCLAGRKVSAYFGRSRTPVNRPYAVGADTALVHRIVVDSIKSKNQVVQQLYVCEDGAVRANPEGTFKRIEEYGDDDNLLSFTTFDSHGRILKSMRYFYQGGKVIARAAKGIEGNVVRCPRWEEDDLLYYKLYYNNNDEGNYSSLLPVDEWNHSSVLWMNGYVTARLMSLRGCHAKVYSSQDEYLFDTPIFNTYNQMVFKPDESLSAKEMAFIHVLSSRSRMYSRGSGVKDGDRIVEFGAWKDGMPLSTLETLWQQTLSSASSGVKVSVLRPEASSLKKLSFTFSVDASEVEHIEMHRAFLSREEMIFLKKQ